MPPRDGDATWAVQNVLETASSGLHRRESEGGHQRLSSPRGGLGGGATMNNIADSLDSDVVVLLEEEEHRQDSAMGGSKERSSNSFDDTDRKRHPHTHAGKATAKILRAVKSVKKPRWTRAQVVLLRATILAIIFMVLEIVGGYVSQSVAIASDAAHMFSDVSGYIIALAAAYLSSRGASRKYPYGYKRVEVLGALLSVIMIWVVTIWLVLEAVERLVRPQEVNHVVMVTTAAMGIFFNVCIFWVLGAQHHHHYGMPCSGHHHHSHGDSKGGCGGGHDHGHDHSHSEDLEAGHHHCHHSHPAEELSIITNDTAHQHEAGVGCTDKHHARTHGPSCHHSEANAHHVVEAEPHSPGHHHGHVHCGHSHSHHDKEAHGEDSGCHGHSHAGDGNCGHGHHHHEGHRSPHAHRGCSHAHGNDHDHHVVEEHSSPHSHGHHHSHVSCEDGSEEEDCHLHHHHGHGHADCGHDHENLNVRGAVLHALGDLLQSIGVLIAGLIMWAVPSWWWADPIATLFFSVVVFWTTKPLIADIFAILMQRAPTALCADTLETELLAVPGALRVDSLSVWSLSSDHHVMTAHVYVEHGYSMKTVRKGMEAVCRLHRIGDTTIQMDEA